MQNVTVAGLHKTWELFQYDHDKNIFVQYETANMKLLK